MQRNRANPRRQRWQPVGGSHARAAKTASDDSAKVVKPAVEPVKEVTPADPEAGETNGIADVT